MQLFPVKAVLGFPDVFDVWYTPPKKKISLVLSLSLSFSIAGARLPSCILILYIGSLITPFILLPIWILCFYFFCGLICVYVGIHAIMNLCITHESSFHFIFKFCELIERIVVYIQIVGWYFLLTQVCRACGLLGYYNHKLKTGICSSCKNGDNISTMKLPYACKLLIQVLYASLEECQSVKSSARFSQILNTSINSLVLGESIHYIII